MFRVRLLHCFLPSHAHNIHTLITGPLSHQPSSSLPCGRGVLPCSSNSCRKGLLACSEEGREELGLWGQGCGYKAGSCTVGPVLLEGRAIGEQAYTRRCTPQLLLPVTRSLHTIWGGVGLPALSHPSAWKELGQAAQGQAQTVGRCGAGDPISMAPFPGGTSDSPKLIFFKGYFKLQIYICLSVCISIWVGA